MLVLVETPEGSTTAQTLALVEQAEDYLLNEESKTVESVFAALGFSFGGTGQSNAMLFAKLDDMQVRVRPAPVQLLGGPEWAQHVMATVDDLAKDTPQPVRIAQQLFRFKPAVAGDEYLVPGHPASRSLAMAIPFPGRSGPIQPGCRSTSTVTWENSWIRARRDL